MTDSCDVGAQVQKLLGGGSLLHAVRDAPDMFEVIETEGGWAARLLRPVAAGPAKGKPQRAAVPDGPVEVLTEVPGRFAVLCKPAGLSTEEFMGRAAAQLKVTFARLPPAAANHRRAAVRCLSMARGQAPEHGGAWAQHGFAPSVTELPSASRLDRMTSGCLAAPLSPAGLKELSAAFRTPGLVHKTYFCLCR